MKKNNCESWKCLIDSFGSNLTSDTNIAKLSRGFSPKGSGNLVGIEIPENMFHAIHASCKVRKYWKMQIFYYVRFYYMELYTIM